ncbi:MAG: SpoIIIAH-like family protein [bacterium]|jgi:stage III sporulation protein AH
MAILLRREWVWLVICLLLVLLLVLYPMKISNRTPAEAGGELATGEDTAEDLEKDIGLETGQEQGKLPVQPEPVETDFFIEYRLERERVRSQQMDMLREIVHNPNSEPESRKEAYDILLQISQNLEREMELEGLIKAKGFRDAVVFINLEQVHVVVKAEDLEKNQVAQLGDLVQGMCAVPLEAIVIDNRPR